MLKLVTYLDGASAERVGIAAGGEIVDLGRAAPLPKGAPPECATDMLAFIRDADRMLPFAEEIAARHAAGPGAGKIPREALLKESASRLLSPVPRPLSMRDGYAFRQHVESARKGRGLPMIPEFDLFPIFYYTNHLAVTGPGDVLVMEKARERLDFELEVAVVIGREARNIAARDADDLIFGYMIMNDWSARALQTEEMKLNLGPAKGKDFATSLGPYLVPRKHLSKHAIAGASGERHDLAMKAFVNGKQLSADNLKNMNWTFGQILERVAYGVTLRPGEVIGSGTCGTGCLMELNGSKVTDNLWLKAGDEVVMEVEELGRLVNRIVPEEVR